jgi:putative iron-regulated protein
MAGERMKLGLLLHDPKRRQDCFSDNTHNSHYYDALGIAMFGAAGMCASTAPRFRGQVSAIMPPGKNAAVAKRMDDRVADGARQK